MEKPYVIINCAMSADGKIALPNGKQLRISCDEDIERMYKLRNQYDAVLVGVGTILSDDPKLTVKDKYIKNPKQPIRIILDTNCKTPTNAQAVSNNTKTYIFTKEKCNKNYGENVNIIQCPTDKEGLLDLDKMLNIIFNHGVKSLMVEGGSKVIWSFLNKRLADDLYIYVAPIVIGGKNTPTLTDGIGIKSINDIINLKIIKVKKFGPGLLIHYKMIK